MYLPKVFQHDDTAARDALIDANPFATLIANDPSGLPFASHLPLVHLRDRGVLVGHMARANPQWRYFDPTREVLVIFHGPHAMVHSTWYQEPTQQVPTWNYAVVHAYAKPTLLPETADACRVLALMTERFQPEGMPLSIEPPAPFIEGLTHALVAFELHVTRWEPKWKMSQNRDPEDRERVEARLRASNDPTEQSVAAMMRALAVANVDRGHD